MELTADHLGLAGVDGEEVVPGGAVLGAEDDRRPTVLPPAVHQMTHRAHDVVTDPAVRRIATVEDVAGVGARLHRAGRIAVEEAGTGVDPGEGGLGRHVGNQRGMHGGARSAWEEHEQGATNSSEEQVDSAVNGGSSLLLFASTSARAGGTSDLPSGRTGPVDDRRRVASERG